jgi:hypothetical protein
MYNSSGTVCTVLCDGRLYIIEPLQFPHVNISFLVVPFTVILPYFGQGPLKDGQTLRRADRLMRCLGLLRDQ